MSNCSTYKHDKPILNGKIVGPSGIWTRTFGISVRRSTNWAIWTIEPNWERRANSKICELRVKMYEKRVNYHVVLPLGSIAQLVECRSGIPKVRVQIPLGTTMFPLASQYRFIMFTCCPEDDSNRVVHMLCIYSLQSTRWSTQTWRGWWWCGYWNALRHG